MPPPLFPGHTPSSRVTRQFYPEQWAWWDASGWQMLVEDTVSGGLILSSVRSGKHSGGAALPQAVATRTDVELFLTQMLYQHLHPRKARVSRASIGQVATAQELASFVLEQRRKVARLAL